MKINFIYQKNLNNSVTDINILNFLFKKLKDKTDINYVEVGNYKIDKASINIFIGVINPILFDYAKINILLFDNTIYSKSWNYLLNKFDHIITKTKYETELLTSFYSKNKITFIGWRSTDLNSSYVDKKYTNFLLFCYEKNDNYKKIIELWKSDYPTIVVVNPQLIAGYNPSTQTIDNKSYTNIVFKLNLQQTDFESVFNECGVHICPNKMDSFSHVINQAALCRSVPLILDGAPMNNLIDSDYTFTINCSKKKNKQNLGYNYIFDQEHFQSLIERISKLDTTIEEMGNNARHNILKNNSENDGLFKSFFKTVFDNVRNTPKKLPISNIDNEDYPTVSILTLTHNRKNFFPLAIFNYNSIDYPKDKLEWIIYDTSNSDNCVEQLLPPQNKRDTLNIKYIYNESDTCMSIGECRNLAVNECTNEIVVIFDDDDYYPKESVKNRVKHFIGKENNTIDIVGCTMIGSFDINKYISFIESHSIYEKTPKKIKIASLAIRRSLLEKYKFDDTSISEVNTIVSNNTYNLKEISWEDVIISLTHSSNTTYRNVPKTDANGCHFGFNEKIFNFLTSLDKST